MERDHIQGSGIAVDQSVVPKFSDLWARRSGKVLFRPADERREITNQAFPEGALSRVEVNRYERDPQNLPGPPRLQGVGKVDWAVI